MSVRMDQCPIGPVRRMSQPYGLLGAVLPDHPKLPHAGVEGAGPQDGALHGPARSEAYRFHRAEIHSANNLYTGYPLKFHTVVPLAIPRRDRQR